MVLRTHLCWDDTEKQKKKQIKVLNSENERNFAYDDAARNKSSFTWFHAQR